MTDKDLILDFIKRLEPLIAEFKKNFEIPQTIENPEPIVIEHKKLKKLSISSRV